MKKVRVALIAGKMVGGGVESLLLEIIKYIDKETFVIDLLVDEDSKIVPEKEIKRAGVRLIYIPPYQKIIRYLFALKKIFSENKYDIVHANVSSINVFSLIIAKSSGVPIRISHNHNLISPNAGVLKNSLKRFFALFSNMGPNFRVAPTNETGKWLFRNKDFFVVRNGVETKKFLFEPNDRELIRKSLNLKDEFLIGSFGRMITSKNILFILKVIEKVILEGYNIKLLLIGNGPEEKKLKLHVLKNQNLKDKVIFLDNKKDIYKYYSALDLYVFPSTAEAFGMTAVEAQINGLECMVSKGVPNEARVIDTLFKKQRDYSVNKWAEFITNRNQTFDSLKRRSLSFEAGKKAFSAEKMVEEIEGIYRDAIGKN